MSEFSQIGWTDATWNPLLGCSKCSAGCQFCYAIKTAWRLQHNPNPTIAAAYAGLVEKRPDGSLNWTGRINLNPERLQEPVGWKKGRRIFVNSQSDLFHDDVPESFIDQVFAVMAICPQHTFQVLTKRASRMQEHLSDSNRIDKIYGQWAAVSGSAPELPSWPLKNVHLGTSVENQKATSRIGYLMATPAAVRFLSCEPLLGPLDLYQALRACWTVPSQYAHWTEAPASEVKWVPQSMMQAGWRPIDWVIVGGESGTDARPMHPDWARSIRDQCAAVGVPFNFKQWGEFLWRPTLGDSTGRPKHTFSDGVWVERVGKREAGRVLDGVLHNAFPTGNN